MTELTISWLLTAICVALAVNDVRRSRKFRRELRHVSSRFRLFAGRDALVDLVAVGAMSEEDEAWQITYQATNAMLNLKERLDLEHFLENYMQYHMRLREDRHFARGVALSKRKRKRAERACHEFKLATEQIEEAFQEMVLERTTGPTMARLLFKAVAKQTARGALTSLRSVTKLRDLVRFNERDSLEYAACCT